MLEHFEAAARSSLKHGEAGFILETNHAMNSGLEAMNGRIVKKYRVDSFIGTNLDHILRWNGIRTIVILGAGAEAGIVPTVTYAFNLGYFVVAVGDCIRPTEPAWLDDAMKFIGRSATVRPHGEIIQAWRTRSPA